MGFTEFPYWLEELSLQYGEDWSVQGCEFCAKAEKAGSRRTTDRIGINRNLLMRNKIPDLGFRESAGTAAS
jgi:hypothetical protein